MGGACLLVGGAGYRIFSSHPDVYLSKSNRESIVRDNKRSAKEHHDHAVRMLAQKRSTEIMPGINNALTKPKIKAPQDDDE